MQSPNVVMVIITSELRAGHNSELTFFALPLSAVSITEKTYSSSAKFTILAPLEHNFAFTQQQFPNFL